MSETVIKQGLHEVTRHPHGAFSWADALTTDVEGAKQFYTGLFGWTYEDIPMGNGMFYTMAYRYEKPVAGLMGIPGVKPVWQAYINVDDVDATLAKAHEAGARLLEEPVDVYDSGRMGRIQDPGGAEIAFWQPYNHPGSGFAGGPGVVSWHEAWAPDLDAALQFYSKVVGWQTKVVQMQGYVIGLCSNEGQSVAVIRPITPESGEIPPSWSTYFGSTDVYADAAKVQELGGSVLHGPMVVEGYAFAACVDPQGAVFFINGAPPA